jgi:hypothetical protein
MAGERIAARRHTLHPNRRAGLSRTAGQPHTSTRAELSHDQPSRVLENISERLLEGVAERFQLGSPPPAAGSP